MDGTSAVVDANGGGKMYVNAFVRNPRNKDVHPVIVIWHEELETLRVRVLTTACTYGIMRPPPGHFASSTSYCATSGKEDAVCVMYVRGSLSPMVSDWKHRVNGNCVLVHGRGPGRLFNYSTVGNEEYCESEPRKAR
jgi:hypothetical protein